MWNLSHFKSLTSLHFSFSQVTAQLPGEYGYTGGKVIFIDSENTLYHYCICLLCVTFILTKPIQYGETILNSFLLNNCEHQSAGEAEGHS